LLILLQSAAWKNTMPPYRSRRVDSILNPSSWCNNRKNPMDLETLRQQGWRPDLRLSLRGE